MSGTLKDMNGKPGATNRALHQANDKLSSMNGASKSAGVSLRVMQQGLTAMRSDIHAMVHKISESFLFRSVKEESRSGNRPTRSNAKRRVRKPKAADRRAHSGAQYSFA